MPYCPRCDMEFVEGVTVCSDCGGPLLASEEEAKAMKAQMEKEMEERRKEAAASVLGDRSPEELAEAAAKAQAQARAASPGVYVNRRQKYDDLKSSASAFYLVGGALALVSVLLWTGIVHLPMAASGRILTQSVLTVMGAAFLIIAVKSSKSAREMSSGIEEEQKRTQEIIGWFCDTYTGAGLDTESLRTEPEISGEELSLRRFDLIQDYLITGRDLPDAAYVEALCEEIYGKLYED